MRAVHRHALRAGIDVNSAGRADLRAALNGHPLVSRHGHVRDIAFRNHGCASVRRDFERPRLHDRAVNLNVADSVERHASLAGNRRIARSILDRRIAGHIDRDGLLRLHRRAVLRRERAGALAFRVLSHKHVALRRYRRRAYRDLAGRRDAGRLNHNITSRRNRQIVR